MSQTTITPHDQSAYVTRKLETNLEGVVRKAYNAQQSWRKVPIDQRIAIGHRFVVSCDLGLVDAHEIQLCDTGRV